MIVDIRAFVNKSMICFTKENFTDKGELISIVSGIANNYGFEPKGLLSIEFDNYINELEDGTTYAIVVGSEEGKSNLVFGKANKDFE